MAATRAGRRHVAGASLLAALARQRSVRRCGLEPRPQSTLRFRRRSRTVRSSYDQPDATARRTPDRCGAAWGAQAAALPDCHVQLGDAVALAVLAERDAEPVFGS